MERNIDNKDFEQFVKRNADQYRMYPSERVWKGIYSGLHTNRKWYGFGFALLFLSAITITGVMLSSPKAKQQAYNKIKNQEQPVVEKKSSPAIINKKVQHNNLPASVIPAVNHKEFSIPAGRTENSNAETTQQASAADIANKTTVLNTTDKLVSYKKNAAADNEYDIGMLNFNQPFSVNIIKTTRNDMPASIESILNSYKASARSNKISWQLYITPAVSYRRLSENKSFLRSTSFASGAASYASMYNVNNVVTHKPDMGIEMGAVGSYSLTKKIKILAGLQFNINRYAIKAFTDPGEIATIALNGGNGNGSDSVAQWTNYRNFNGYNSSYSNWLQNFYFSVSAPIGVELKLSGNSKTQLGIAGTIQPTLIISDRAYLISTDFKNYVEVPWLIRRWNMNTSLETFVSFSTGKINWKVGPQVRYQLLSSFQNKYPVKENLFDFGLKVGILLHK